MSSINTTINTTNYNNIKFIVGQDSSFSKVSKEQFDNDCAKICVGENYSEINMDTYADIIIPTRATKGSAGYDFHILLSKEASKILFEPTEKIVSPTIMTSNIGEARKVIAELIETKPRNYYPLRGDEFQWF